MDPVDRAKPHDPGEVAEGSRFRRAKALFLDALDRSESGREAFVLQATTDDPALRDDVLSLLASERAGRDFGEVPAAELLAVEPGSRPSSESRLEPGTRLGAYEVISFLSAGGMGEVYRGRHTVLGRVVALKTLNAGTDDPLSKRRLIREAQHAASLDHPGICTIHEVGEDTDRPYIVMEFVEGRRLSGIIAEEPPPFDRALGWALQVADALDHAHGKNIIHRDLKSSNVMIDGAGRAKVLDFGLSRRLLEGDQRESTISPEGALAGTLSHMSPEALLGRSADMRSDIWSFGVLLYELVTGRLPFRGRTAFETSAAIINEQPDPARGAPIAIRLVIEKCLAKDPAARYQRVGQISDALHAIRRRRALPLIGRLLISARKRTLLVVTGVAALGVSLLYVGPELLARAGLGPRVTTLALMPLENATGDDAAEYYAQGLTDGLIERLGTVAEVRVISRGSAARAAALSGSDAEAARRLGAQIIVTGRLRRASDRVAIDLRLFDAGRGRVLWSDTYERSANQVLALQADAVRALANEIRLGIRPAARGSLSTARNVNPEAYEAYLKGRFEFNRRTRESLQAAIAYFEAALELDPTWAPAQAALADCYNQLGTQLVGTGSPAEFRPRAAAEAMSALRIDPASAEAHATLGYVRHYDWQWDEADRELQRAIELNPSYALARIWYANLLASRGRLDQALEQVLAARELDPFSLIINTNVGWIHSMAGRYDEAAAELTHALELDSTYLQARMRLSGVLARLGRLDEGLAEARRVLATAGRTAAALDGLAALTLLDGDTTTAQAILAELVERSRTEYVPPGTVVHLYAELGNLDSALVWVRRAFEERANYVVYLETDPDKAPLARDPRFQELVASSGLNRGR